jgi:hypothetical protein
MKGGDPRRRGALGWPAAHLAALSPPTTKTKEAMVWQQWGVAVAAGSLAPPHPAPPRPPHLPSRSVCKFSAARCRCAHPGPHPWAPCVQEAALAVPAFVQSLYDIVSDPGCDDVVQWSTYPPASGPDTSVRCVGGHSVELARARAVGGSSDTTHPCSRAALALPIFLWKRPRTRWKWKEGWLLHGFWVAGTRPPLALTRVPRARARPPTLVNILFVGPGGCGSPGTVPVVAGCVRVCGCSFGLEFFPLQKTPPPPFGSCITILDKGAFVGRLLPRLCNSTSFESFVRQLNGAQGAGRGAVGKGAVCATAPLPSFFSAGGAGREGG